MLVVNPNKIKAKTVSELFSLAKANPNSFDYASPGIGTGSHLTAELFKSMAGIQMTHVPYKGTSPAVTDLLGGQVGVMFGEVGSVIPHIRAGNLVALGVSSERRNPALQDIPAVGETLPGFSATPWNGIAAPPKTPEAIASKISSAISSALRRPEIAAQLTGRNFDGSASTPEEMKAYMKKETERWSGLIQKLKSEGTLTAE